MSRDRLTPNQQWAIETLDRSCVVTAGPGAGKTRVLVERVLNVLRQEAAALDQIIAITFTNKAANEMKEKIRGALMKSARAAPQPAEARRWTDLKRRLDDAAVSTIHGFCAGVLRAQPVEAQVDPGFTILDEYMSRLLLYQASEEVVNELVDRGDEATIRLVTGYTRLRLRDELAGLYSATRTLGLALDEVERSTLAQAGTLDDYRAAITALDAAIEVLAGLRGLTPKAQEQVEGLRETWTRHRSWLPAEPRIEDAPFFDECLAALREAKVERRAKAVKEPATILDERLDDLETLFYDVCGRGTLRALVAILRQIDARYRDAKAGHNGLDYEDLQVKVRDLFRSHPWLARHYAERYRFVLVDEFQDTNGLQKEILDLLMGSGSKTNLFVVGDQKQSVYNFRGAEVELFAGTARELRERGAADLVLEKNFRSSASLIRFFNEFFARLMRLRPEQDERAMRSLGYVEFVPGVADRSASPHPPVELVLEIGEHVENAGEGREREATRIAARIAGMVQGGECLVAGPAEAGRESYRPARYGDIAILFRAMNDIKIYERALRRRGIPYYVLAGKGFYEREEIQDLISLLRFLENRTDEIALVSALRSPLFGVSDESLYWLRQYAEMRSGGVLEHHPLLSSLLEYRGARGITPEQIPLLARAAGVLAHLLEQRNRVSLADLLEEILTRTDYEAIQAASYDGHQRVTNLRKLVELAREFEEGGPHFLRDFIHFVSQFTEMETRESEAQIESGAGEVVRIMTVHKAKGLEFPVVIIPDLARRFRVKVPGLAFDRGLGIGMQEPDRRGRLRRTRLRRRVEEQIRRREHFESQRLLFVAATRARDYLILAGAAAGKKNYKGEDSDDASGSLPREASSWLEWVCTLLGIEDSGSLPDGFEWNGVRFRVSAPAEPTGPILRASERVVDRHAETRRGLPVPIQAVPELTEEKQSTLRSVLKRLEPVVLESETSPQSLPVTRLVSFAQCPLKYYYETVLGLPGLHRIASASSAGPPPSGGSLPAATRGILLHRFCESYTGAEERDPLLRRLVDEELSRVESGDRAAARERAFAEIKPLAERYLHSELWQQIEQISRGGRPGRVESEVEFVYHSGVLALRGRMDKIIVHGDDRATIVDFKTDRVAPDQVEELAGEYELQMQVYALAARHALKLKEVQAELHFLEPSVRFPVVRQRLDEPRTTETVNELCRRILGIRRMSDAPARPGPRRCRRCGYFSFCPSRAV